MRGDVVSYRVEHAGTTLLGKDRWTIEVCVGYRTAVYTRVMGDRDRALAYAEARAKAVLADERRVEGLKVSVDVGVV